jgi:peptidoglycan/xylan/chitin deacetylase (PgdA/CDA1 family)
MGKVIVFHEVDNIDWIDKSIFSLKKRFKIVDPYEFEETHRKKGRLGNMCLITVDDGASSFYKTIFPVLKKYKVPAILFVSPKIIIQRKNYWFQEIEGYDGLLLRKTFIEAVNQNLELKLMLKFPVEHLFKCLTIDHILGIITRYREKYNIAEKLCMNMSVDEIKEVDRSGLVTIGAHTLRHPVLANEDDYTSRNEIIQSVKDLEKMLERRIIHFAYPNGLPGFDFGEREIDVLKESGCRMVFTTLSGNMDATSDLLNVSRYGMTCGDSAGYIRLKLCFGPNWNRIMRLKSGNEVDNRIILRKIINV